MKIRASILLLTAVLFAACGAQDDSQSQAAQPVSVTAADAAANAVVDAELPLILVYKSPSCGCCNGWIEHMEGAGFTVDARDVEDIVSVKRDAGVPDQMHSCHTGLIDGYVVEGHVPAEQVKRLLAERPDVAGIAVPGMPMGSPGMPGDNSQGYQVYTFDKQGRTAVFAEINPR